MSLGLRASYSLRFVARSKPRYFVNCEENRSYFSQLLALLLSSRPVMLHQASEKKLTLLNLRNPLIRSSLNSRSRLGDRALDEGWAASASERARGL